MEPVGDRRLFLFWFFSFAAFFSSVKRRKAAQKREAQVN